MVTYRGFAVKVQYDEETAYGTGATPATAIGAKLTSVTINKGNNLIRTLGLGEGRNETKVLWGNFDCTWSIEMELASPEFLQFGIGSLNGSGTTVAPYYLEEEEFMDYTAGADSGQKSFGMEVAAKDKSGGTDEVETLAGCIMNTIAFNIVLGATLKCTVDGFAQTSVSSTSATQYTPNTTNPWIYSQGVFKWHNSEVARITSATITIANNFDPEVGRELGSRFVTDAEPGLRKYDWTITVKMTSAVATTLRDDFYGQDNSPNLGVEDAEPTFYEILLNFSEGSSTGDRNMNIKISQNSINDISKPINIGENIVELTINGSAKRGLTDTVNKPLKWWTAT